MTTRASSADLLAGLSIAGLLLPEAVAYSGVANLPPQAGVIALFAGLVCYGLIGRSRFAIVTATSSSAAVLASATLALGGSDLAQRVALAPILVVGAGFAFALARSLRLGTMSNLIARPVLRGYAFGLALVIAVKQWPHLVDMHTQTADFFPLVAEIVRRYAAWQAPSLGCGLIALGGLFGLERLARVPGALVVIVASILASSWLAAHGVALTGCLRRRWTIRAWTMPFGANASVQINHLGLETRARQRVLPRWRAGRFVLPFTYHSRRGPVRAAPCAVPGKPNERISTMKKQSVWLLATLAAVLVVGCANQKAPAEQAVAGAETALAAVRDNAQKYVPDQLQAVESQLAALKDSLAKGDYKSVLTGAPTLNSAISAMKDAADAKKADADAALAKAKDAWGPLSAEVPKMVDAIQSRVNALSKSRHLPKGVTKASLASGKSGVDSLKSMWSDASNASASGDFTTAVTKAQAVKDKAAEIMKSLGMSSG
jgi:hypothetical protein